MARFFSSPGFRDRDDGWFRVGTVEVTTTMLLVGLGFKVAAVPFHAWAPDVY